MSDFQTIEVEREDGIAILSLNRPEKMNSLNKQMFAELQLAFADLRFDDTVRAVVLAGNGKAFSAGGDISELQSGELSVKTISEGRVASKEFVMSMQGFEKPIIGAIDGLAAGGGAALLMLCDVVFASPKASFSVIFKRIGMVPDCGTLYLLPRIVGPLMAKQLAFSGEIIDADEMYRIGLVNEVVEDDVLSKAKSFAKECADGPGLVLGISKMLIDRTQGMDIEAFFDYESLALPLVMQSEDFSEGVKAFVEKRTANFGQSQF